MRPKFLLVALALVGLLMTAGVQAAVPVFCTRSHTRAVSEHDTVPSSMAAA